MNAVLGPKQFRTLTALSVGLVTFLNGGLGTPLLSWGKKDGIATFSGTEGAKPFYREIDQIKFFLQSRMKSMSKLEINRLAQVILNESRAHNISSPVILALIETESNFKSRALSYRNAYGLMQIQYTTAQEVAKRHGIQGLKSPDQLYQPMVNVKIGVRYLASLKKRFGNKIEHALGAYNFGPSRYEDRMRRSKRVPGEVRDYVKNIMNGQNRYKAPVPAAQVKKVKATAISIDSV